MAQDLWRGGWLLVCHGGLISHRPKGHASAILAPATIYMNKLCCELNTWLVCDGCEWKQCTACYKFHPFTAPWDEHNQVSKQCYVAQLRRDQVHNFPDPFRSGVTVMGNWTLKRP